MKRLTCCCFHQPGRQSTLEELRKLAPNPQHERRGQTGEERRNGRDEQGIGAVRCELRQRRDEGAAESAKPGKREPTVLVRLRGRQEVRRDEQFPEPS